MKTGNMALKIAGYASIAVFALAAVSCGTKKSAVPEQKTETASPAEVVKKTEANVFDGANTERRINIEAGGLTLGGTMRLVSGKKIWFNVSALGISFARAVFTRDSLMYYEKAKKTAFSGSWNELYDVSKMLRIAKYDTVEDLICARPLFGLSENNFSTKSDEGLYVFSSRDASSGFGRYVFVDNRTFRIARQILISPDEKLGLEAEYEYAESDKMPSSIRFSTIGDTEIGVKLSFTARKTMLEEFPFRIPPGYSDVRELARAIGVDI